MKAAYRFVPVMVLAIAAVVRGQVAATSPAALVDEEIPQILLGLEREETRKWAAERLMGAKAAQLAALHDALENEVTSDGAKDALKELLSKVHARLRVPAKSDFQIWNDEMASWLVDYEKFSPHDPRWDQAARQGLASIAWESGNSTAAFFNVAATLGCPDPVIRYYQLIRMTAVEANTARDALAKLDEVAKEMQKSPYSSRRKFYANLRFVQMAIANRPNAVPEARLREATQQALELSQELFKNPMTLATRREALGGLAHALLDQDSRLGAEGAMEKVMGRIEKQIPDAAERHAIAADIYVGMGWSIRGNGLASTVKVADAILFEGCLKLAALEAVKGWKLDPTNRGIPATMIEICKGLGSPREEMEKWFKRGILSDPDRYETYASKLSYLAPKWHGSKEELLKFGQECLKIGTPENRLSAILLAAHHELCGWAVMPRGIEVEDTRAYYADARVWADVEAAYEKLLSDKTRLKTDREVYLRDRGLFLRLAHESVRYKLFVELSEEYGDELNVLVFRNPYRNVVNGVREREGLKPLPEPARPVPQPVVRREPAAAGTPPKFIKPARVQPKPLPSDLPPLSLRVRGETMDQVIAKLNEQLGAEASLTAMGTAGMGKFTLDIKEKSLWEILSSLREQQPFELAGSGGMTYQLRSPAREVLASKVSGDVMVVVHPFVKSGVGAQMQLEVGIDPRAAATEMQIEVSQFVDDSGQVQRATLRRNGTIERLNPGIQLVVNDLPREVGKDVDFNVRVTYSKPASFATVKLNDIESHLNEPLKYGENSITIEQANKTNTNITIRYRADTRGSPRGQAKGRILDSTGKLLREFAPASSAGFSLRLAETKGPYRLEVEYVDKMQEKTVDFVFESVPFTFRDPQPARGPGAP